MDLKHSTNPAGLLGILNQGIVVPSSASFKGNVKHEGFSDPRAIYLSAVGKKDYKVASCDLWGDYHFFLDLGWVKSNSKQFRSMGYSLNSSFPSFMSALGIIKDDLIHGPEQPRQVISLKDIPLEAISDLIVPGDSGSKNVFFDIYGVNPNLISGCKIYKIKYDQFIDLREIVPSSIKLYVGSNEKTVRVA